MPAWHEVELDGKGPATADALSAGASWRRRGEARRVDAPPGRLDASIRGTPRIAGSPEAGSVTYVTRSRVVGFPDYATVAVTQRAGRSYPVILSRLRFGGSDLGVNRARVTRRLEAQTPPADAR